MDKSREQFEEFAKDDMWLERMRDGSYKSSVTRKLWDCWQASRAALVVQLPDWDAYDTPRQVIEAVMVRLDSVGIKWTE